MRTLIVFDRVNKLLAILSLTPLGTEIIAEYPAANNTTATSRGPWPAGLFKSDKLVQLDGEQADPNGPYGEWFLRFVVPDRDGVDDALDLYNDGLPDKNDGPGVGMGIHAGRRDGVDSQGRSGYERATLGCIRTTTEAMDKIATLELPLQLVVLNLSS